MGGEISNDFIISLGGDTTDYDLMAAKVIKETTELAEKVKNETTEMVKHVVETTKKGQLTIRSFVQSSAGAAGGGGGSAGFVPIELADMFPEVDQMKADLADLAKYEKELTLNIHPLSTAMGKFGNALQENADIISFFNPELGGMAASFGGLAAEATPVAAGIAVFGAAVYATTYALHGQEAANNSLNDSLELGKILLAGASFGYADYTEATKMAKDGEEALAKQVVSSGAVAGEMIQRRINLIDSLKERVEELGVVSDKNEEKFIKSLRHDLSKSGATGGQIDAAEETARRGFEQNFIDDQIIKLKEKVDLMGRSAEEIGREVLLNKNASAADLERYDILVKLKQAKEESAEQDKQSVKDAQDLAKHGREMAEREIKDKEKLASEGKRLADSLRTDEEKKAEELAHVNELFEKGAISAETLERAILKINEAKDPKSTKSTNIRIGSSGGGIDAVAFGSSADYSVREQIKQQEKMLDALSMIADNTKGSTKVTINPIRLRGA